MSELFLKELATNGAFCILFVWLLLDTRKENRAREDKYIEREERYVETINRLTDKEAVIAEIQKDVKDIKKIIRK